MTTLFLYLSREGQTRRISERLAAQLAAAGDQVRVADLNGPEAADALAQAQRIVIGASVHYGHLPEILYRFIECHRTRLAELPGAFFCVNLTARKAGKDTPEGSVYMRKFRARSTWHPQLLGVFAGALRYPRYTWYDRLIIRFIMWLTKGPTDPATDMEFTDWTLVHAFGQQLLNIPKG